MTRRSEPDGLAKSISHVLVGVGSAAVAGYVLVNVVGLRRSSLVFQLLAAGSAIWLHKEMDLPVARQLAGIGL